VSLGAFIVGLGGDYLSFNPISPVPYQMQIEILPALIGAVTFMGAPYILAIELLDME
jgi:hypothetical protein